MKILMVGPNTKSKGGIATVIRNFQKYYTNNSVIYFDSWVENQRLKTGFQAFFRIKKKVKQAEIDIVHFHVAQKGSFYRKALLAKRVRKQTKVIFHMHASQFDTFYNSSSPRRKKHIKNIFDNIDGLVVLSEEWGAFYKTITSTEITIIENAVAIPDSIQYDVQSKNIITLGRIGKRKGSYDILQLAEKIEPIFPEIKFVLYGDGEIDKIRNQIKINQISNVSFGGWISKEEQVQIMKTSLLHLLPSYQEGLPMSILETMSYGVPNLTTKVGGIPQVLDEGINGMLVEPGDINSMFKKLCQFLEKEEIRNKYSKEAYSTIKARFSLSEYFTKWNHYYTFIEKKSGKC